MQPHPVVKGLEDRLAGLCAAPERPPATQLALQRLEKRLCRRIVPWNPLPAHALTDVPGLCLLPKFPATMLGTPIRVGNKPCRRFPSHQRHHQCLYNQIRLHPPAHRPSNEPFRAYKSMMTHSYTHPSSVAIWLMSYTHTWFIRGTSKYRSRRFSATGRVSLESVVLRNRFFRLAFSVLR